MVRVMPLENLLFVVEQREFSGSVVECLTGDRGAAGPHHRHCVVSLSKTH